MNYRINLIDANRTVRVEMLHCTGGANPRGVTNYPVATITDFPARTPKERAKARARAEVLAAQWAGIHPGETEVICGWK